MTIASISGTNSHAGSANATQNEYAENKGNQQTSAFPSEAASVSISEEGKRLFELKLHDISDGSLPFDLEAMRQSLVYSVAQKTKITSK